jgi:hypothetical protein
MGHRHPNPRLVKMHRNYDTHELSKLFGVHKNTVRAWVKLGLNPIDGRRPALFQGLIIRNFLTERRRKSRQTCRPNEMFCLCCRKPKSPAGGMVDYLPMTPRSGNLRGICPDCGNLIHRRASASKLDSIQQVFLVAFPQGGLNIEETADPCVNCDPKEG